WREYALAMLVFNLLGMTFTYLVQRLQSILPGNCEGLAAVSADCAFNTAVSFASNTNWQSYGGETTMSYLTQMLVLTVQNFLSAASGMAVLIALTRAFSRQQAETIGNFFVDLTRSVIFILLPLSTLLAIFLVSQGVVQTFGGYVEYKPLEHMVTAAGLSGSSPSSSSSSTSSSSTSSSSSAAPTVYKIARGPAASQIAIKQLGTNGGGFFNVNSSHPLENPTPLSNFIEMLAILLIPVALCQTFGKMVGSSRNGMALLAAMTAIFVACLALCYMPEQAGNPAFTAMGIEQNASAESSGGNMEGKEVRFGVANSALWAVATTAASNGSVNSMHDSFIPLAGLSPMLLMQLGEVVYGGVGSGLYGMLIFAVITVFIAGLMVGRTPEYLGKKIEAFEMKMSSLVILFPPMAVLLGTALAVSLKDGTAGVLNGGAHGFSEILYAFSSASNNNGSAFAGLSANTPFYNYALGVAMFLGRYALAVPVLALAGSLVRKKKVPVSAGTMQTDNWLFVLLLVGVVVIFGGLTFVPALALGPIVEQLQMIFTK
ncbi:MAG: potassium-transporting ATPase potassium-binding subunit, partial [Cyanobacteriota bacterium erpe_2018_sw_21hr_WHONDRS-SW48-000092_B_bin.40]|nr:potassium-transporting ATPase potassium-binding subunit [Cyanobacteriota bacterium erpe_2018_sw_21hr_WHONDRS-SW48-000092_B_bin.40]